MNARTSQCSLNKIRSFFEQSVVVCLACFALFVLAPVRVRAQTTITQDLVISEIQFGGNRMDPCNQCARDKWVEITNPTDGDIRLDEYTLEVGNGFGKSIPLPSSGTLEPGESLIVANKYAGMTSSLAYAGIVPSVLSGHMNQLSNLTDNLHISARLNHATLGPVHTIMYSQTETAQARDDNAGDFARTLMSSQAKFVYSSSTFAPRTMGTPFQSNISTPAPKLQEEVVIAEPVIDDLPVTTVPIKQATEPAISPKLEDVAIRDTLATHDTLIAHAPQPELAMKPWRLFDIQLADGIGSTADTKSLLPSAHVLMSPIYPTHVDVRSQTTPMINPYESFIVYAIFGLLLYIEQTYRSTLHTVGTYALIHTTRT